MDKARYLGAKCLIRIENDGFSNLTLKQALQNEADQREAAFCTALVYGVVSRLRTLDFVLSQLSRTPLAKLDAEVRAILRSGAYQLLYMDKVPPHAAVDESVKLAYSFKKRSASGLINAVLRGVRGFDMSKIDIIADPLERMGVKYSASNYLVLMLCEQYGEEQATKMLEATLQPQDSYIYINPLKRDVSEIRKQFSDEGIPTQETFVPNIFRCESRGAFARSELFERGEVSVMGLWSAAAACALSPKSGETVADCCAAPGGKSIYMSGMMGGKGKIYSCDINPSRLKLLSDNLTRCGCNATAVLADATMHTERFSGCDRVLCDVPCSGLGVMAAKPEIRYREKKDFDGLYELQRKIIDNCSRYVKPGGRLVYSTCTINQLENEAVADEFLSNHPEFHAVIPGLFINKPLNEKKYVIKLPLNSGESGFFVATFERT